MPTESLQTNQFNIQPKQTNCYIWNITILPYSSSWLCINYWGMDQEDCLKRNLMIPRLWMEVKLRPITKLMKHGIACLDKSLLLMRNAEPIVLLYTYQCFKTFKLLFSPNIHLNRESTLYISLGLTFFSVDLKDCNTMMCSTKSGYKPMLELLSL
jgi:hypothetical protein